VQQFIGVAAVAGGVVNYTGHLRRSALLRRDLFIWAAVILFFNQLADAAKGSITFSIETVIYTLLAISIFQYMAWYVIFRFLSTSDRAQAARWQDLASITALLILLFVPAGRMIWVSATGLAGYLCFFNNGDRRLRSAGIVLAALSVQALWGHLFFNLIALHLLRIETAAVGFLLEMGGAGTSWKGNIITGPTGFGLAIFAPCSSFHNLSLALLCWVTVTRMRGQYWSRRTFVIGAIIGTTMIAFNFARLYLMALDADSYDLWHEGAGAEIFAVGASLSVLLISLIGIRKTEPSAA
jgi:Transmembrane exosortase (Exosortase_EpsH)